jgi:plastocyanin
MFAELSSDRVVLGLAFGIPVIVMLFVALGSRPRTPLPVVALALLLGAGLVTLSVVTGLTGKASEARLIAPAPTGGGGTTGQATCQPSGASLQLSAQNISFSTTCLAAPANRAFTITFENRDANISHSVRIFSANPAQDPSAKSLFRGKIFPGPATITYQVPALPAGTYFFHCDIHPTRMFGTFVVSG